MPIGQELEAEYGIRHLPSDFKKQNGYLRSLQLSEEYGLYRQDYCGCEFSAKARGTSEPLIAWLPRQEVALHRNDGGSFWTPELER